MAIAVLWSELCSYDRLHLHEHDFCVVASELIESAKNDKRGEISIAASIALAGLARCWWNKWDKPAESEFPASAAVTEAYHNCKGNMSTTGADPALRLCFAKAFERDINFYKSLSTASFDARPKPFAENFAGLIRGVLTNDDRLTARSIVFFEYLDKEFKAHLLDFANNAVYRMHRATFELKLHAWALNPTCGNQPVDPLADGIQWSKLICAESRKRWWRFR